MVFFSVECGFFFLTSVAFFRSGHFVHSPAALRPVSDDGGFVVAVRGISTGRCLVQVVFLAGFWIYGGLEGVASLWWPYMARFALLAGQSGC